MTVRALFFSVLRDIAGSDEVPLELAPGATVGDFLAVVFERWPKLAAWDRSLLVAVDCTYAKRDGALHEGAEVAVMPPVQGG